MPVSFAVELLESAKPEHFSMYIRFSKAVKKRSEYVTPREYELINVRGHIDRPVDGTKFTFDGIYHKNPESLDAQNICFNPPKI